MESGNARVRRGFFAVLLAALIAAVAAVSFLAGEAAGADHRTPLELNIPELLEDPSAQDGAQLLLYRNAGEFAAALSREAGLAAAGEGDLLARAEADPGLRCFSLAAEVPFEEGTVRPCFFLTWSPGGALRVEGISLACRAGEEVLAFHGTLFYNLEEGDRLYWDLNGDLCAGEAVPAEGEAGSSTGTLTFQAAAPEDHRGYLCQSGIWEF